MTILEELTRRGLIAQMTAPDRIERKLNNERVTFYIGFDATADSLHVGHYLALLTMRRLQLAGHQPIALLGTGTTMVGDPTGRTDMRKMLTVEEINANAERFKAQISRFVSFEGDEGLILRNGDWLLELNYVDLLRNIGVHFSVNRMLTTEGVKSRLERGLSFIEFNYAIMQAYDFLHMFQHNNCTMQLGGDDQWSNIISGVDLIRRVEQKEAEGMTLTLLTRADGVKMGKTLGGALWLDRDKVSPYDFFQYWRNVDDLDVIKCLKMLTFVPVEEIEELEKTLKTGEDFNNAKEMLAYEITKIVHGEEDAEESKEASRSLFSADASSAHVPTTQLADTDFEGDVVGILDLLVKADLAPSKSEARRLVEQGGIVIDGSKIEDVNAVIAKADFKDGQILVKKGKKTFKKVTI